MSRQLRILLLGGNQDDARLILNELCRAGFDPVGHRAETESEFVAQLDPALDIILVDHCPPRFDALRAVDLVWGRHLDVPVIMITGALDDESAAKCLKQGACDYLLKDRLARLGPAVANALDQTQLRITRIRDGRPPLFSGDVRDSEQANAAKEALGRLADLVGLSDDAIISESLVGLIMSWNAGAARIFGYRAEEVLGRSVSMLGDLEHADESRGMRARICRGERIEHFETVRLHKDGSEIVVMLSASPIRDTSGVVIGTSNLVRDQTAQKRTEHEMTRLNLELQERVGDLHVLLDIVPIGVWIGDATAERIVGNRVAYEMIALPAGSNISPTASAARAGTTPGYRCFRGGTEIPTDELPMQTVARTGVALKDFEQDLVFDDGRVMSMQGSVAPLVDDHGKVRGVIGAWVDITGRKQTEEALRTANRRKDEFLAALSHELRTPLTPVLMTVTTMLDVPPTANELQTNLAMIRDNVELQARLIDDLLDTTRIAQGKMQFNREVVDVHTLIHRALDTCRDVIDGRFSLALDLSAARRFTVADPVRLQQVFWNLIKNAAKFTPPGGEIAIRSRNEPGSDAGFCGECLIVEVSDTGIGIETEALERIFQVFEQSVCSRTRRFGGLGIGLAISRSLIEAHLGRLTAASAGKDRGATFIVELPAQTEPAPAPPTTRLTTGGSSRPQPLKILLVDDNKDTLRYLALALCQRQHTVRPAADLASARQLAATDVFDLVISDLDLPDGSGLDLMKEINQTRGFPGIACSGYGSDEDIRMSMKAGFAAHLTKPIDFETLEQTMRQVVSAGDPAAAI